MIIDIDANFWSKVFKKFINMNVNMIDIDHLYHLYYECYYKKIYKKRPTPEFFDIFIKALKEETKVSTVLNMSGNYLYNIKDINENDLLSAIKKFERLNDMLMETEEFDDDYLIDNEHKEAYHISKDEHKKVKIATKDKATIVAIIYKLVHVGYRTIDLTLIYDCYNANKTFFTNNYVKTLKIS